MFPPWFPPWYFAFHEWMFYDDGCVHFNLEMYIIFSVLSLVQQQGQVERNLQFPIFSSFLGDKRCSYLHIKMAQLHSYIRGRS